VPPISKTLRHQHLCRIEFLRPELTRFESAARNGTTPERGRLTPPSPLPTASPLPSPGGSLSAASCPSQFPPARPFQAPSLGTPEFRNAARLIERPQTAASFSITAIKGLRTMGNPGVRCRSLPANHCPREPQVEGRFDSGALSS
jgi:hypothetical protein